MAKSKEPLEQLAMVGDALIVLTCPQTDCVARGEYKKCYLIGTEICKIHKAAAGHYELHDEDENPDGDTG